MLPWSQNKALNIDKTADEDQAWEQAERESEVAELCADIILPAAAKSRQPQRKSSNLVFRVWKKSKRADDSSVSGAHARECSNKQKYVEGTQTGASNII